MKKALLLLLVSMFCTLRAFSACELYDLTVDRSDCNSEKKFTVVIDFKYKEAGECFTIKGNGKTYGTFKYTQLPVQLILTGDCKTEYEFVIRDCKTEACKLTYLLGKVCCETECELSDLNIERTECNEEQFFCVYLGFKYQGTSNCFSVSGNGKNYGKFSYSQVPVKICGLKGNCETEYEFVIQDCEKPECTVTGYLGIVCCEKPCKLYDLVLEKGECTEKGQFYTFLNFKYKDTSDCFKVFLNGKLYGSYMYYQLPLKIGPLEGDCKTKYEFTVVDCKEESCKVSGAIGPVCCEKKTCSIRDLQIKRSDCNNDKNFFVKINFRYSNTSNCFMVKGNGQTYGTFNYTQLPITIGPLKGDCKTHYEFIIVDCENELCRASKSIGRVCCEKNKKEEGQSGSTEWHLLDTESNENLLTESLNGLEYRWNGNSLLLQLNQSMQAPVRLEVISITGSPVPVQYELVSDKTLLLEMENGLPGIYLVRIKDPFKELTAKFAKW